MDRNMFCFQCEQTAGCSACTGNAGVCGKKADTANLQDQLTGALIGLAKDINGNEKLMTEATDKLVVEGLFSTLTNVNFNDATLSAFIEKIAAEPYPMKELWNANEDIRSLKSLILFGIRGLAAYAYHAKVLGYQNAEINRFFYKALSAIGMDDWGMEELLPIVMEVGEINLKCMALLDKANTETYGNPVPSEVSLTVEKGPFIVISGHDLYDLKQLLEQTEGKASTFILMEKCSLPIYPELKICTLKRKLLEQPGRISRRNLQIFLLLFCLPPTVSCLQRQAMLTGYLPQK